MSSAIPPNLIASLLFGVGQIVAGGALAWIELSPRKWRLWRAVVAGAAGLWFFVSGVCELLVSGIEARRAVTGGPRIALFTSVRAAADTALFAWTVALAVGLVAYFVARAIRARRAADPAEREVRQ
ncbi:MAG TPA: hypothetical protein VF808_09370 [Ktedonobacterales bacterium]